MKNYLKTGLSILFILGAANFIRGQGDSTPIVITHQVNTIGGTKPVPIALEGFTGEVAEALRFDLYVQGFSFVSAADAQFVVSGSNSGNVAGKVTDSAKRPILPPKSYAGASPRTQAHAFANDIVQAITGKPGISVLRGTSARIAFKAQPNGVGAGEIYASDFDGHNASVVTTDHAIVAAPSWVPGRLALCYNSYAIQDNPYIFYHDLKTGDRKVIARHGGSSISPSVSPDGSRVAMVLSVGGRPNIYVSDIDGKNTRQLTADPEDSSPCWSPDGRWICFATKVDERRVLAKVSVDGGPIQKISTSGAPNPSEPDWSPDGKWIAFTSQSGNYFNICVIPADGSASPIVVSAGEDPSWAPNSRTLVFARRSGYVYTLSVLDVFTKQSKDIARISGSDSEPSWAK